MRPENQVEPTDANPYQILDYIKAITKSLPNLRSEKERLEKHAYELQEKFRQVDALILELEEKKTDLLTDTERTKKEIFRIDEILKILQTISREENLPRQLNILYVEDNKNDQAILRRILSEKLEVNFDLTIMETGETGLRELSCRSFDLVILDYRLPKMTGLEFLDRMAELDPSPPVIFLTGKGDEKVAVEAMKRGSRDYIVKDEISDRLVKSIKETLMHGRNS